LSLSKRNMEVVHLSHTMGDLSTLCHLLKLILQPLPSHLKLQSEDHIPFGRSMLHHPCHDGMSNLIVLQVPKPHGSGSEWTNKDKFKPHEDSPIPNVNLEILDSIHSTPGLHSVPHFEDCSQL
jgi:hypothetical protein